MSYRTRFINWFAGALGIPDSETGAEQGRTLRISNSAFNVSPDMRTDATWQTHGASAHDWLSGGTSGTEYAVTNRIVTTGGRTVDRTIIISVQER